MNILSIQNKLLEAGYVWNEQVTKDKCYLSVENDERSYDIEGTREEVWKRAGELVWQNVSFDCVAKNCGVYSFTLQDGSRGNGRIVSTGEGLMFHWVEVPSVTGFPEPNRTHLYPIAEKNNWKDCTFNLTDEVFNLNVTRARST